MEIVIRDFDELDVHTLYALLRVRQQVFIVEQECAYMDLDDRDQASRHIYIMEDGQIVAYARIVPRGVAYPYASLGRIVTLSAFRNRGYGKILVEKALEDLSASGETAVKISAQVQAIGFYEKLGFRLTEKEQYDEDDIPHREMVCEVKK
ncbi:MAG TPA: GNAT family N-acetyltransferase [Clostridiaceae bacterium]|nr:GNAT family N-acetyltransferase [Clostridiaceae bacterium]